jgi:beta-galactosidase
MQVAEVHVNGRKAGEHVGGYLPFTVDLTDLIDYSAGADNVIAVRLDNRDNPLVPPGKPLAAMDLTYQGGLYRNVWLDVTQPVHVTDAVAAGQVASGGVFVQYPQVSKELATIDVRTHVMNEGGSAAE